MVMEIIFAAAILSVPLYLIAFGLKHIAELMPGNPWR